MAFGDGLADAVGPGATLIAADDLVDEFVGVAHTAETESSEREFGLFVALDLLLMDKLF